MLRLSTLARDVISQISGLIDGSDLLRLYLAGERSLSRLLSATSRSFSLELTSHEQQPLGAVFSGAFGFFPHLSSMSIQSKSSHPEIRLTDLEIPSTQWPTLRTLSLDFEDYLGTLLVQDLVKQQALPSLTDLTVIEKKPSSQAENNFPLEFMQKLPSTLTSLTVDVQSWYAGSSDLLPPHLTHLTLRMGYASSFSLNLKGLTLLDSLTLDKFDRNHVKYDLLPASLRSLHVELREGLLAPPDWSKLFPQLTSLTLGSQLMLTGTGRSANMPIFPPTLKRLSVTLETPINSLGTQLIELYAPIIVDARDTRLTLDLMERLPKLESAMIPQPDRFTKIFPASLTRLTMLLLLPAQLSLLPETITELTCSIKGQSARKYSFPARLKTLTLRQCQFGPTHPMRYDYLPNSLTSLNIWAVQSMVESSEIPLDHVGTLQHLHRLTFLSIGAVVSSEDKPVLFPFEDASALPPSLTHIQVVGVAPTENFWRSFGSHLCSLVTLESMMKKQDASVLLHLPSSLQSLNVQLRSVPLTALHIESLPRSLRRLSLSEDLRFSEEALAAFANLPPSLNCLTLSSKTTFRGKNLPLSLSSVIPITINEFVCDSVQVKSFIQRKKEYYAKKNKNKKNG